MIRKVQISRYRPGISPREEVLGLLAESVGNPVASELEKLVDSCEQDDYPDLWIANHAKAPIGLMRLDSRESSCCTITHIAVISDLRNQGIGRNLIEFIGENLNFQRAEAETDDDALCFYKACGFQVEPIGINAFGVRRYLCVRTFSFP